MLLNGVRFLVLTVFFFKIKLSIKFSKETTLSLTISDLSGFILPEYGTKETRVLCRPGATRRGR